MTVQRTRRGEITMRRWAPGILLPFLLGLATPARAVLIDNGIPEDTLGHWSVNRDTGGQTGTADGEGAVGATLTAQGQQSEGLTVDRTIVYAYWSYVDPGIDGGGFRLSGTVPEVDPDDPDRV